MRCYEATFNRDTKQDSCFRLSIDTINQIVEPRVPIISANRHKQTVSNSSFVRSFKHDVEKTCDAQ